MHSEEVRPLRSVRICLAIVLLAALLGGCAMQTVDKLYCLPRRSQAYNDIQSAIDAAMGDRSYCAPTAGENRQTVQMVDLDGDGAAECLLFTKSASEEKPLQILIFHRAQERYELADTISCYGTAFDRVEYAQIDGKAGKELLVGCRISDQVPRAVSVYAFSSGKAERLVSANYTNYLCFDLNGDACDELFLLSAGNSPSGSGVAQVFGVEDGALVRYNEARMSEPVEALRRIVTGKLSDGHSAVYVASAVDERAIVTDVYAIVDGVFTNVSFSNESGTSVQTLRSYDIYADDIDNDGVVELPDPVVLPEQTRETADEQYLIRWYAMAADGSETDRMYTFHNFSGGWYLELDRAWARKLTVSRRALALEFYLSGDTAEKVFTIYTFTGEDREEQAAAGNRFVLYRSESATYAMELEAASGVMGLTREGLISAFHPIQQDWKTGET